MNGKEVRYGAEWAGGKEKRERERERGGGGTLGCLSLQSRRKAA